jgi:uncharacterized membrane protein required for colicin V production
MNIIDFAVLIMLIYFVYRGAQAGLVDELLGITGWVVAVIVALHFGGTAGAYVVEKIPLAASISVSIVGFVVTLFVVHLAFRLLTTIFKKAVSSDTQSSLDRFFGAAIGFIKGAFYISLLALALLSMPLGEKFNQLREESQLYPHMTKVARIVVDTVMRFIPQIRSEESPDKTEKSTTT